MKKYKCAICGKMFEQITHSHLRLHGLTRGQYREIYGNEGIIDAVQTSLTSHRNDFNEADAYAKDRQTMIRQKINKRKNKIKAGKEF